MKVFVTGAAGYLGLTLVPHLLVEGYEVVVLDNFMYERDAAGTLNAVAHHPRLDIQRGDVRDQTLIQFLARDADFVIPLAAIVGAPACEADLHACWSTNLHAVEAFGVTLAPAQNIIIPISNSGYGIGEKGKMCTEESPLRPISAYGESKVKAEAAVMRRGNAVSLRLATVFGLSPRMRMDLLVNDFVWQAVTRKSLTLFEADAMRNYVHVRDVARVFVHVMVNWPRLKDNIYNVGDTQANMSKRMLAAHVKQQVPDFVYNTEDFARDPDQRDYLVSNEKIEKTGWKPAFSIQDGIAELIKGYRQYRKVHHGNA